MVRKEKSPWWRRGNSQVNLNGHLRGSSAKIYNSASCTVNTLDLRLNMGWAWLPHVCQLNRCSGFSGKQKKATGTAWRVRYYWIECCYGRVTLSINGRVTLPIKAYQMGFSTQVSLCKKTLGHPTLIKIKSAIYYFVTVVQMSNDFCEQQGKQTLNLLEGK